MRQKPTSSRRRSRTKSVLRLPDLEHAKAMVLNSLNSTAPKGGYRHAIDEFVDWHCSEPRLAFDRLGHNVRVIDLVEEPPTSQAGIITSENVVSSSRELAGKTDPRSKNGVEACGADAQNTFATAAAVVLKEGCQVTAEELRSFFACKFAKWQVPDEFIFVPSLPHTSTGKLLRSELRKQFQHWEWSSGTADGVIGSLT